MCILTKRGWLLYLPSFFFKQALDQTLGFPYNQKFNLNMAQTISNLTVYKFIKVTIINFESKVYKIQFTIGLNLNQFLFFSCLCTKISKNGV